MAPREGQKPFHFLNTSDGKQILILTALDTDRVVFLSFSYVKAKVHNVFQNSSFLLDYKNI